MSEQILKIQAALYALCLPGLSRRAFLHVHALHKPGMIIFQVEVAQPDMARMVGRQGANVACLKALAMEMGAALGLAVRVNLNDPEQQAPNPEYREAPWSEDLCLAAVEALLGITHPSATCAFVPGRQGQSVLMVSEELPPEVSGPLSRWLHVIGAPAGVCLVLDESTTAA